jgi:flagellar biosynthesis protein FliR
MNHMFNTSFKIAWRHLLKNKLHTAINIGGLMIGFTIGLGIFSCYRPVSGQLISQTDRYQR